MIDMQIILNPHAIAQLEKIPMLVRMAVIDKALPAMAKPILQKAKDIVPRSKQTGSRDRWHTKVPKAGTENFDPDKWRATESGDYLGYRVRKTPEGAYLKVGSKSPKGNKQRFNQTKYTDRKVFYWGRDAGITYHQPYRTMQKSFDETISQQHSAFNAALTSAVQGFNLG